MTDTQYTDQLVCPWCGHVDRDSYESFPSGRECCDTQCPECDKPYRAVQHITIKYSTKKISSTAD